MFGATLCKKLWKRYSGRYIDTFCFGAVNIAPSGGKWYFFYDWDHPHSAEAQERLEWFLNDLSNWEIRATEGGYHLLSWTGYSLDQVVDLFLYAQRNFPGDYLWTVPLTIRTSQKWDVKTGVVVSPKPRPLRTSEAFERPLRVRTVGYRNWEEKKKVSG